MAMVGGAMPVAPSSDVVLKPVHEAVWPVSMCPGDLAAGLDLLPLHVVRRGP